MEKTVKAAPSKVFDISKPGKSMANATSRPVIVSNRPIMQDPMMSKQENNEPAERPRTPEKVVLKPLVAEETDEGSRPVDTIAGAETSGKDGSKNFAVDDKLSAEPSGAGTETSNSNGIASKAAKLESVPEDAKDTGSAAANSLASDGTPPLDGTNATGTKESAELEAIAKQLEEIEKLTENRDYFLPINSVEKRRSKIVTLLGLLLIVVLGLLLVNLMLDVGVFHINGVKPVTHFFSS